MFGGLVCASSSPLSPHKRRGRLLLLFWGAAGEEGRPMAVFKSDLYSGLLQVVALVGRAGQRGRGEAGHGDVAKELRVRVVQPRGDAWKPTVEGGERGQRGPAEGSPPWGGRPGDCEELAQHGLQVLS